MKPERVILAELDEIHAHPLQHIGEIMEAKDGLIARLPETEAGKQILKYYQLYKAGKSPYLSHGLGLQTPMQHQLLVDQKKIICYADLGRHDEIFDATWEFSLPQTTDAPGSEFSGL